MVFVDLVFIQRVEQMTRRESGPTPSIILPCVKSQVFVRFCQFSAKELHLTIDRHIMDAS